MAGSKISLCYDTDTTFNGNEHWIEIDGVAAANGGGTYTWNTTGVAPGTYYVAGYMFDGGKIFTFSHLTQSITITAAGRRRPSSSRPHLGHRIRRDRPSRSQWTADGVVAGSKISLCYDTDTTFNGNEHWIEIDGVAAANGSGTYTWNTTGVAPGTYYLAGYMYDGKGTFTFSHLTQAITITAAAAADLRHHRPDLRHVSGGPDGRHPWTAGSVAAGSKISLCYDADTTFNGNEHWIEIDGVRGRQRQRHVYLEHQPAWRRARTTLPATCMTAARPSPSRT